MIAVSAVGGGVGDSEQLAGENVIRNGEQGFECLATNSLIAAETA